MRLHHLFLRKNSGGVRFACAGRWILPPKAGNIAPAIAASLFILAIAVYAVQCSLTVNGLGAGPVVTGGVMLLLAWLAIWRIMTSDPGILPRHVTALQVCSFIPPCEAPEAVLGPTYDFRRSSPSSADPAQGMVSPTVRWCVTCRIWRPPGAHHCRTCDTCVAGFDHHCDVINKCVGAGNMHAFLCFEFAVGAAMAYLTAHAIAAIAVLHDRGADYGQQSQLWIAGGSLLGIMMLLSCLRGGSLLCLHTMCASFLHGAIGGSGLICLVVAFIRTSPDVHLPLLPCLLGVPLYLSLGAFSCMSGISQTCLALNEVTRKDVLRGTVQLDQLYARSTRQRVRRLMRLLCATAPPRLVDFGADVSSLAAVVKSVQKSIFDAAMRKSQESASLSVGDVPAELTAAISDSGTVAECVAVAVPANPTPSAPATDDQTVAALAQSVASGYMQDVHAVCRAYAAAGLQVAGVVGDCGPPPAAAAAEAEPHVSSASTMTVANPASAATQAHMHQAV